MRRGQGVITRIDGKTCEIHSEGVTYRAYIPKRIRGAGAGPGKSKPVCVGDHVEFSLRKEGEEVVLEAVEPRRTKLSRTASGPKKREQVVVSNVDQLLIVTSIYTPPFHPGIIDRFLIAGHQGEIEPLICINKMDLLDQVDSQDRLFRVIDTYRELDYTVITTSTQTNKGVPELLGLLKDKSTVVVGHSGVGKSSLLLAMDPNLRLVTKEVGKKSKRGQHATTSVSLLPLAAGGYVVDTPGIREFSLWETEATEVSLYFPEMVEVAGRCKYGGSCTHTHEPHCAVKKAVEAGEIEWFRYNSYRHIVHSVLYPDEVLKPGEDF